MTERDSIVRWLRRAAPTLVKDQEAALLMAADNIEAYADLKKPEPTIPFEQWRDEPNVGH